MKCNIRYLGKYGRVDTGFKHWVANEGNPQERLMYTVDKDHAMVYNSETEAEDIIQMHDPLMERHLVVIAE